MLDEITKIVENSLEGIHGSKKAAQVSEVPADQIALVTVSALRRGMMQKTLLQGIAVEIGNRLRRKAGLNLKSDDAFHIGLHFLLALRDSGIIQIFEYQKEGEKFWKYAVCHTIRKWELLKLFDQFKSAGDGFEVYFDPCGDWTGPIHSNGTPLLKFHDARSLSSGYSVEDIPMVYKVLNRKQRTGWSVNNDILPIYLEILKNGIEQEGLYPFDFMDPDMSEESRESKINEASLIGSIAEGIGEQTFYHQYNLDFRGRVYPTTLFFHEQSSDNAKGLMVFAKPTKLRNGYRYLMEHIANCWGWDKVPLAEKLQMAVDAAETWIGYAEYPFENTGWMEADKSWSFLAGCIELCRLRDWEAEGNPRETFPTNLPCYIDGANNGLQHIAALTRDEVIGGLVNLIPSDEFGDAYMFMADAAYDRIKKEYDPSLNSRFKELRETFYNIGDHIDSLEGPEKFAAIRSVKDKRSKVMEEMKQVAPNYWMQEEVHAKRRKTVKRNVMTLGYGGTEYGFMKQIVEDTKNFGRHWKHMEYSWAGYMGSWVYNLARGNSELGIEAKLPGLAKALTLFETLADRSSEKGNHLTWRTPVTNFKVVQHYTSSARKRVETSWDGKVRKLNIKMVEVQTLDADKERTGASPNIVHSFDAAHLIMTCEACDFDTSTVHDSFGCMAGDMDYMFKQVRKSFVDFHSSDPLLTILDQNDSKDLMPELGDLDITDVLKSDFAFA